MKKLFAVLILIVSSYFFHGQKTWTLQECIEHALNNNLSLKQADLNITFEEIALRQAKGNMLPNFNASASHGYNFGRTLDPVTNDFGSATIRSNQFGLQSSMALFNGFKLLNGYKQTINSIETKKIEFEKLQNDISLNVANSYLNILYNKEFLAIAEKNLTATEMQFDLIQKQVNAGSLPIGNLYEIEAQKSSDESSAINANNNLEMSYLILQQLIRLDEPLAVVVPEIPSINNPEIATTSAIILQNALVNFPEIRQAENNVLDAVYGLKIAEGGKYPSLFLRYSSGTGYSDARKIGLNPEILSFPVGTVLASGESVWSIPQEQFTGFETQSFSNQLDENINHSLILSMSVPIFNGWTTKNNIERAKLNQISSEYRLEETKQQLKQEVEKAWLDTRAAKKSFESAQKTVISAQKAYEFAQVKYQQGVINLVEQNLARTKLDIANAQLIQNKFDFMFKLKVLEFYQGKPISDF